GKRVVGVSDEYAVGLGGGPRLLGCRGLVGERAKAHAKHEEDAPQTAGSSWHERGIDMVAADVTDCERTVGPLASPLWVETRCSAHSRGGARGQAPLFFARRARARARRGRRCRACRRRGPGGLLPS